eukprot:gnl/TRDRNA2_/TRDRNA2_195829_c0_seq1.p1 gnl/TRDRNA2_/TRDRNA2_195829_c0~~gnl/TRDRNA2_/TRDRNA2_195829_c0_seq1.p1  ORF type:complete len:254 (+),score=18.05 gnl/TRDRNA2_/TRDRNA2_195829_c0_seq1:76-837(+)
MASSETRPVCMFAFVSLLAFSLQGCGTGGPVTPAAKAHLPTWPQQFQSKFWSPSKHTEGVFAIGQDASGNISEILTLTDGTLDHLCPFYHNNTACTQLTTLGWKWLVFPEIKHCCKCCSYETGCGPLSKSWLQNSTGNMFYDGVVPVQFRSTQYRCRKWTVVGLDAKHPNYYYEQAGLDGEPQVPCEIDGYNYVHDPSEPADDQYVFDRDSFSSDVQSGLFTLPDFCSSSEYCGQPVCDTVPPEQQREFTVHI